MGETLDKDGESMWQTVVMAVARNGYSDAHGPDELRWWREPKRGGWKANEADEASN